MNNCPTVKCQFHFSFLLFPWSPFRGPFSGSCKMASVSQFYIFLFYLYFLYFVSSIGSSPKVSNLKLIDSAVMQFSERRFTRYQRLELMALKDSKSSQSPPWCQYDPKIIRLNILKYKQDHTDDYENKLKTFRDLLPNLSLSHVVDPKLMGLLNNYHISLMNPEQNQSGNSETKQMST